MRAVPADAITARLPSLGEEDWPRSQDFWSRQGTRDKLNERSLKRFELGRITPRSATPARSTAVIRKADAAFLERGRLSTINNYSSLHNVAQNSNLSDSCIALQEQHAARAHHAPRRAAAHETTTTQSTITLAAPPRAIETRPVRVERVEAIYRMGRRGLNRTRAGRGDARGHHAETPRLRVRRSAYVIVEARGADLVERAALLRPALDSGPTVVEVERAALWGSHGHVEAGGERPDGRGTAPKISEGLRQEADRHAAGPPLLDGAGSALSTFGAQRLAHGGIAADVPGTGPAVLGRQHRAGDAEGETRPRRGAQ